jgi:hypothetical protein
MINLGLTLDIGLFGWNRKSPLKWFNFQESVMMMMRIGPVKTVENDQEDWGVLHDSCGYIFFFVSSFKLFLLSHSNWSPHQVVLLLKDYNIFYFFLDLVAHSCVLRISVS